MFWWRTAAYAEPKSSFSLGAHPLCLCPCAVLSAGPRVLLTQVHPRVTLVQSAKHLTGLLAQPGQN